MRKALAVLILLMLPACSILEMPGAAPTSPPGEPVTAATSTPPEVETEVEPMEAPPPTATADLVTLTPTPPPTEPPLMTAWPLAADLFYLNDAGQVWWQPLAGDENAAASVTRLDLVVRDFDVAPGGDWLLYRTDEFLAVTSLTGTGGQMLDNGIGTPPEGARGQTVCWSPDASKVAYTTGTGFRLYIPGAGVDFGPLVFDAPEEPLVDLGWSADSGWLLAWRADGIATLYRSDPLLALWVELGAINGYTWLADGRLAFAPAEGGLALVHPEDLDSRAFMVRQDRPVSLPGQQPDGTLVFFVHDEGIEGPGFLYLGDPEDLSFHQEGSLPVQTADFAWNPTSTRLIGRDPDDPTTILLLDALTGAQATFEAAGSPVGFGWGDPPPQSVTSLPLPADLYFLAPKNDVTQVWRLPSNGQPPEVITDAIAGVTAYDVAPDGTEIAYTSEGVIYRAAVDTLSVSQVIALLEPVGGTLDFSPDGKQIAYANNGLWIIDLETGEQRRLVADTLPRDGEEKLIRIYSHPQWSPDGAWLLAQVNFYEGYDFALLSTGTRPNPITLGLFQSQAKWTGEGLVMVYNEGGHYGEPTLKLVEPGTPTTIIDLLDLPIADVVVRPDGSLALLRRLSPAYTTGPTSVQIYGALLEKASSVPIVDLQPETGAIVLEQPVLSPDGVLIAGLAEGRMDEFGTLAGQLMIVNPATGEMFVIEGLSGVYDVRWAP
jgi:hypothetical protein